MKKPLGKLTAVDLREYWADEAREFTPWLAEGENLKLLGEAIGLELELAGTEKRVGSFKADILAKETGTDNYIIIENQLERTNHDHLGKLITYAAGLNAKAVVWVAPELCEEHRRALDWLNEVTDESLGFFGIEVELWRIGDSEPAPKFTPVCQPNEWAKSLGSGRGGDDQLTDTKLLHLYFWRGFVDFCKGRGTGLGLRKPRPQHWYSLAVGRSRFNLSLTVNTQKERLGCELYINHAEAKRAFAELARDKQEIESALGASLEWQELPHAHACRIAQYRPASPEKREEWPELFMWLKERAEAFYRVFSPRVRALELEDEEEEEDAAAV